MPDTVSKLQIFVFAAISLVPGTTMRYMGLGLATASLLIYAAHYQSPSQTFDRLEDSIKVTEEILEGGKMHCARDQVELMRRENRLRQAKILASKIQTRMHEAEDTTWEEYFQVIRGIMQSIDKCRREVKEIQSSTLGCDSVPSRARPSFRRPSAHRTVPSPSRHGGLENLYGTGRVTGRPSRATGR
ncbi:hypothetical protein DFH09DRAFT_1107768 [Mycena vulgaris]|nr:hypothetical protein DFH09DRAFT_1107768 [Mycena vulgaris]